MLFLTEAHFEILKPPLNLWRWNETYGGLGSQFQVPIGLTRKIRQHQNWQFTNYLEKRDFLQTTPNIDNIYIYIKSNLEERRIDTCHFRVRMAIEEREMANGSHGSTTPFSSMSFPANQERQGPGQWPSSLREVQCALNVPERAWILTKSHDTPLDGHGLPMPFLADDLWLGAATSRSEVLGPHHLRSSAHVAWESHQ